MLKEDEVSLSKSDEILLCFAMDLAWHYDDIKDYKILKNILCDDMSGELNITSEDVNTIYKYAYITNIMNNGYPLPHFSFSDDFRDYDKITQLLLRLAEFYAKKIGLDTSELMYGEIFKNEE